MLMLSRCSTSAKKSRCVMCWGPLYVRGIWSVKKLENKQDVAMFFEMPNLRHIYTLLCHIFFQNSAKYCENHELYNVVVVC